MYMKAFYTQIEWNCEVPDIPSCVCSNTEDRLCSSAQLHRRDSDSRRWRLFFSNLPLCRSFISYLPYRLYSFLLSSPNTGCFFVFLCKLKGEENDRNSSNRGCLSERPEATFHPERFILLTSTPCLTSQLVAAPVYSAICTLVQTNPLL